MIKTITLLSTGLLALGLVSTVNAALVSTLGGLAVYDTDRDISWLANTPGAMDWADANTWVDNLSVGGVTDWRLPTALNSDGTGPCSGFNCDDSEMGHLFYNELGGTAFNPILSSGDPDLALFNNIVQSTEYWSGTGIAPGPGGAAWDFNFGYGGQGGSDASSNLFVWAVHSGDVGASSVPEPGTIALMGLGLVGLLGLGCRQRRL